MIRYVVPALLVLLASSSTAHAHSLWILVQKEDGNRVAKVWYSDHAEPGRARMLQRLSRLKATAWRGAGEKEPLSFRQAIKGETGELTTSLQGSSPVVLEAICDIGVREPRQRRSGTPATGGEGRQRNTSENSDRPRQAGRTEGRTGRESDSKPFREIYFCRYVSTEVLQSNTGLKSEDFLLDLVPKQSGDSVSVSVFDQGKPAADVSVSITGPGDLKLRTKTDTQGKVIIPDIRSGRYTIRAKSEISKAGELDGQPFAKTVLTSSMVFDVAP